MISTLPEAPPIPSGCRPIPTDDLIRPDDAPRLAGTTRLDDTSIVIVTWNNASVIGDCLRSLASAVRDGATVVVVDNASTDATAEIVAGVPGVRLVRNATNLGLAAANNVGIAETASPFVLVSNPDVVYGADTVGALRRTMDERPRAGFVFARLHHADGSLQTTVGDLPRLSEALLGRQVVRRRRGCTGFWWDGFAHDRAVRVGHGLEACYLVRRTTIDDIGPQDERFWLDWEGVDWCARGADVGWESWLAPDAQATHLGGDSLRQAPARWIRASHRSMYEYFRSRRPAAWRPVLAGLFTARAAVKLVAARVRLADYDRSHPTGPNPTSGDGSASLAA